MAYRGQSTNESGSADLYPFYIRRKQALLKACVYVCLVFLWASLTLTNKPA